MQQDIYNTDKRKEYLNYKNEYSRNMSYFKEKTEESSSSVLDERRYRKKKIKGSFFNIFLACIVCAILCFCKYLANLPLISIIPEKIFIIIIAIIISLFIIIFLVHVVKKISLECSLNKEIKFYTKEYNDKAYDFLNRASTLVIPMLIEAEYGIEIEKQRLVLKPRKFKRYCKKINKLYKKKFKKLKIYDDDSAICAYYEEWYYEKTKSNEQERRNEEKSNLAKMYNKYS